MRPTGSSNARMLLVYLDPDSGNILIATGSMTEFANTITGTAQSAISEGLVVNEDGGGDADDDLRAETLSEANAFVVDASGDVIQIRVPLDVDENITGEPKQEPLLLGTVNTIWKK